MIPIFYILVDNENVVQQSFSTIQQAREYMRYHHLAGQVIDEQILRELRQEVQQSAPPRIRSIIRKPYMGQERNVSIPVCRPATTGHNVRQYHSFKPKKVRNFRGLIQ